MTDKDNITLPREVVEFLLGEAPLDGLWFGDSHPTVGRMWWRWNLRTALYTALAAEQPKHPGYILGSHWLETAYSRVCAGEAEADVLRDCGWERVDDVEALRRDAERWRSFEAVSPYLRRLLTENLEIKAANRDLGDAVMDYKVGLQAASDKNASLHIEIEALRRDAERYRWMTEDHPENETRRRVYSVTLLFNAQRKEHIDAAIDAAMKEGT